MHRYFACLLFVLPILGVPCHQDAAGPDAGDQDDDLAPPPLEISFAHWCGLPEGRQQVYDPKTGVFHVHFKPRDYRHTTMTKPSAFEVTKVAERFAKPVVFRLTGVPQGYGCVGYPLGLYVGDANPGVSVRPGRACGAKYVFDDSGLSILAGERCDRTLFRVVRKDDVVTVEFTEKGQALLQPGVQIAFAVDTGW